MQNSGIKFLLTVLILTVAGAGYFITSALDRLRESNYALVDAMNELKTLPASPAAAVSASAPAAPRSGKPFANRKFYAPEAANLLPTESFTLRKPWRAAE